MVIINLATLDGADGFRLDGIGPGDVGGGIVSNAGDINGDGFADLIIGSIGAGPFNDPSDAGPSFVVFGKASGFAAAIDAAALDGADGFRLDRTGIGDYTGNPVSGAGDINGDGFADLIIGTYKSDPNGDSGAGESYVIFGKELGFSADVSLGALNGTDGFRLDGIGAGDNSGRSVSGAGDVNGDGFDDLVIGAYRASPNGANSAGQSYVVFGKASGFPAVTALDSLDGTDGFRLDGIDQSDRSGISVSGAGDVNGDGLDDLIIGAGEGDPNGVGGAGESYVMFGKESGFPDAVGLGSLDGTDGFRLDGIDVSDGSGFSVSGAGDVNGDGFADVIIGAFLADPNGDSSAGESYVVFGRASGFPAAVGLGDLGGADGFRLDGIDAFDNSGSSVSGAGDVNGDGFDDLIVGAKSADPNADNLAGESYVVFGKASGFTAGLDLASLNGTDGFRLEGIDPYDFSGGSVSGAGDVNGDGFADLMIGAFRDVSIGRGKVSESYVIFGFDSGSVTHQGTSVGETLTGDGAANVIIGDLGDDILVGAGGADVFRGGAGDDILDIADLNFRSIDGGTGADTLRLSGAGLNLDFTAAGSQSVASVEAIDLAGPGARVTLDRLSILNLSEASNSIAVSGDTSTILALADSGWTLTNDNGETHAFANGVASVVLGSEVGRIVTGSALSETLLGGDGDDVLGGGAGNDVLDGGEGNDTANYDGAGGLVGINLTNGAAQDGDGGSDTLTSIENLTGSDFNDVLIGNAGVNSLTGGAGNDRLDGRAGDDRMEGGSGNDLYIVTDSGDVVIEGVGEGTKDRINVFADFTNADNVEFLVALFANRGLILNGNDGRESITGANRISTGDTIGGGGGNDKIIGLVGNDILNGGAGNDRIFGNSGLDVIDGGAGDDVVTGQQGADTFIVGLAAGRDAITDFNGAQDLIDLSAHGFADFAAVQAATSDVSGSAVIDLGGANSLKLLGVLEASLASDDFILA